MVGCSRTLFWHAVDKISLYRQEKAKRRELCNIKIHDNLLFSIDEWLQLITRHMFEPCQLLLPSNIMSQLDGSKSSNMDVRLGAGIALERGMLHAISLHNFWWFRNFHALRMVLCVGKHVQMLNSRAYVWNVDSVDW